MSHKSSRLSNDHEVYELDEARADAIEHYIDCNIRFRSPNRNVRPKNLKKLSKHDTATAD